MKQEISQNYAAQLKKILVRPGPSLIHGVGLIAIVDISQHTRVLYSHFYAEQLIAKDFLIGEGVSPAVVDYIEAVFDGKEGNIYVPHIHEPHLEPFLHHICFINHSPKPNCIMDKAGYVVSQQEIFVGDEVTIDYVDYLGADSLNARLVMKKK